MKTIISIFAFLLPPLLSYGQLDARIDSIDFSQNILIENKTRKVDHIIEDVPSIIIKTIVTNKSNKDIVLIPAAYNEMAWIAFKQGKKFYYIPAIWIDLRTNNTYPREDLHIAPNEKIVLSYWGYAPDIRERPEDDNNLIATFFHTDTNISPVWVSRKKLTYPTWFQEVLPSIRLVLMYGLETGQPSVWVSKPVDPRKTIITGNILDQ